MAGPQHALVHFLLGFLGALLSTSVRSSFHRIGLWRRELDSTNPRLLRFILPLSLLFTYVFFAEYLPPLRAVHIPYDLQGYHYPLNDYAFQAIKQGRFPEWDPSIYCGMPFAGNLQTQTFYPPMWLLYLANWHRSKLSYLTLEIFVFLHVWLTFFLGYIWLNRKGLLPIAAVLGAGILAYSGYLMLQLQHLGLVAAYTWIPLGFLSIDKFIEQRNSRALWKLVAASVLAFLAGYPPTWVVFAICMLSYATVRFPLDWKPAVGVSASLCLSLLLCMVQLLPAFEAANLKEKTQHYGPGIVDPLFYLAYLVPNYFDFGLKAPVFTNFGYEYLYLGSAGILGLLLAGIFLARLSRVRGGSRRKAIPLSAVAAVCLILVTNPFNAVRNAIQHSPMLFEVLRGWYFLAGIIVGIAGLAAQGFDAFLRRARSTYPAWYPEWITAAFLALIFLWTLWQIRIWLPTGRGVPVGWTSAFLTAVTLLLLGGALVLYRSGNRRLHIALIGGILLLVAADYKVFGTSLRMNAAVGDLDRLNRSLGMYPGMNDANYLEVRSHPEYRVLDDLGNTILDVRHYGLTTPQGADPLMPLQYRALMKGTPGGALEDVDATRQKDLLRLLAVRYVLSFENAPRYSRLAADPGFKPLPSNGAYYRVFEFLDARPSLRWEHDTSGSIRQSDWKPERREAQVSSAHGGRLILIEEFYPGWEAWVDGRKVVIDRANTAFQSIWIDAGEHKIVFRFRSLSLRWGAAISGASALMIMFFPFRLHISRVLFRRKKHQQL